MDHLVVEHNAGIVCVKFQGIAESGSSVTAPVNTISYPVAELERRFDRGVVLEMKVLAMNGKERTIYNVWKLLSSRTFVRIPNSEIVLHKQSTHTLDIENQNNNDHSRDLGHEWAVLLREKGTNGQLTSAKMIDLRVGCIMDGAVVHYEDGHWTNCGPQRRSDGSRHTFGGHASKKLHLPPGVDIAKVRVAGKPEWNTNLDGIRMTLSNGTEGGHLNSYGDDKHITVLEPAAGERIIGFYGHSQRHSGGYCVEFGIITAPKDIELPEQLYDMAELQNPDVVPGVSPLALNRDASASEFIHSADRYPGLCLPRG